VLRGAELGEQRDGVERERKQEQASKGRSGPDVGRPPSSLEQRELGVCGREGKSRSSEGRRKYFSTSKQDWAQFRRTKDTLHSERGDIRQDERQGRGTRSKREARGRQGEARGRHEKQEGVTRKRDRDAMHL
jgi:hypothetical protein